MQEQEERGKQMNLYIPKTIRTQIKIAKFIYAKDFVIATAYMATVFTLEDLVSEQYRIIYYILNVVFLLYLLLPSKGNIGKKNYYAILMWLRQNKSKYKSIN